MLAAHEPEPVGAYSTDEQEAVRVQMERLLRSAHFRNSKRYPTLLRYLVEETLAGHSGLLKERILGMEVFGRAPDYDTSTDPIVRVTIAEIRKRIAQYYHEDAHSSELRIELTPGSYIPEFITGRHVTENTEDLHVNVAPSMREPDPAIAFEPAAAERAVVAAVKQPSCRRHLGLAMAAPGSAGTTLGTGLRNQRPRHLLPADECPQTRPGQRANHR